MSAPRVSGRKLEAYFARLSTLEDAAESAIFRFCLELDFTDWDAAAAALSEAVAAVIDTYGAAMGEAGAAWIAQTLSLAGDATGAQLVEAAALEALAVTSAPDVPRGLTRAILEAAPQLASDREGVKRDASRRVGSVTAAEAKRRGWDMLTETVARADATAEQLGRSPLGLLVAWVPSGSHPCGFCTMLASNGWRAARREALDEYAAHIHAGCKCQQVFRPVGVAVGGFSPKKWRGRVDAVRDPLRDANGDVVPQHVGGKPNPRYWPEVARAIDRANYAAPEVGDLKRLQHREAYARRKEAGEDPE